MPSLWEWVGDATWTHEVARRFCLPSDGTSYGSVIDQDLKPPQVTMTFRNKGMTLSEIASIIALQTRGYSYTITDKHSNSYTGTVISLSYPEIPGTTNLHSVTLQLRV